MQRPRTERSGGTGGRFLGRAAAATLLLAAATLAGCSAPAIEMPAVAPGAERASFVQFGTASWYGYAFQHRRTASGERFDMNALTAAHRSLPLNTIIRVTNLENGQSIKVRVNDRGPFQRDRILDLSAAAARGLGMRNEGVVPVRIEVYPSDQAGQAAAGS